MVVRAALRFGFGTASLLAGSWLLRALHGAPAALGASPAEIEAVARRSPNFSDGAFVNIDPASGISLDSRGTAKVHLGSDRLAQRGEAAQPDSGGGARADGCRLGAGVGLLVRPLLGVD